MTVKFSQLFFYCFTVWISCLSFIHPQIKYTDSGIPLITNYLPKDYNADVQCWSVVQDKRGLMYFSNFKGVLEYDGVNWRLIKIPNGIVRSLAIDENGVIYVGGFNEIGYLTPDASGQLEYKSLNSYLASEDDFGEVWSIFPRNKGLYIQTISTLYLLKAENDRKSLPFLKRITSRPAVEKWITRTRINPILSIGERIFVQERNIGLEELKDGKLQMLPGGEQFAKDMVFVMLPYPAQNKGEDKILVGSLRGGIFIFDGNKFEKLPTEADEYLQKNRLYFRGAVLSDGSYALGTQLGGVVVIDKSGKLKKIIDKKAGLSNNSVWDIYYDREGNLWAGLDNGIAKILYPSPISMIDERFGYEGTIINMFSTNEELYLATASGMFYSKSGESFQHVKEISTQSWKFLPLKNTLLTATNSGIFELNGANGKPAETSLRFTNILHQSRKDPDVIYVGMYDGVAVLNYKEDKLKYIGHIPVIINRVSNFAEDSQGDLWCVEMSGSIFCVKTPHNKNELSSYKIFTPGNQIIADGEVKLFQYKDTVYFYNGNEIYKYNYKSGKLVSSGILKEALPQNNYTIMSIIADPQEVMWCLIKEYDKAIIIEVDKKNNKIRRHNFLELVKDKIPSEVYSSIIYSQTGKNKILWVGATNTLIKFNPALNLQHTTNFSMIKPGIRRVIVNDSSVFGGYPSDETAEVKFPHNASSINFEYSLPSYVNEFGNNYQYLLDGFDENWSSWSGFAKKEYTNLSPGEYTFKVRSRNALGEISNVTFYRFTILPPWYRTWWINVLGFLILLTILNFLVRYRVEYLKKRNIILERIVNERTAQINEQKETLEKQAEKLREMDKIKSNFFANISHEFRTPLTLIKGQLESVLGLIREENIRKKIVMAFNNSNRLHRLINQILDLSKLESGSIKLELEQVDIIKLISTRIASFESLADKNKVDLTLSKSLDKLNLYIDKSRFEEVIDNLLSNSLKFTPAGGRIEVQLGIEKTGYSEKAIIKFKDTGTGIHADKLSHIFDRFYQADDSSTKLHEGSGLGLSIVKDIIELHGGSVSVESKLNTGTIFTISLPYEEIELPGTADELIIKEGKIGEEEKSVILIVEDNSDMRGYIKENLELHYKIEEAVNGEEGIFKAIEKIPDLIITDVMMPKVDGFELCTNLKHDQRTSHIPIIILTAKADEENKLSGLLIGADDFLAKPFSPRELEIRVGNLIRIRQLLREKYKEISVIKPEDIKANPIDKEFLEKTFTLIRNNLENHQFSVQMLADELAMSVSQLNRKLNALISQSAGKLIRSTKLDYSVKLLEKNAGNITEIGYRIGFSDVSSFTNSFKDKFGLSPSEYQKNYLKKA